jgi:hypothetical protein
MLLGTPVFGGRAIKEVAEFFILLAWVGFLAIAAITIEKVIEQGTLFRNSTTMRRRSRLKNDLAQGGVR